MISNNENETIEIAKEFCKTLKGGEVICLIGNLGHGKTTFMKGVGEYFGIPRENIISPTFIIANILQSSIFNPQSSIKNLIHIDAYRIENEEDIVETGVLEYFENSDSVVFIEWPEKIKSFIKNDYKQIKFKVIDKDIREILI